MRRIIFISPCCCFLLGISLSIICCNALLPLRSSKRFSTPGWSNNNNNKRAAAKRSTVVSVTISGTEGQTDLTQTDYVLEPIPIRIGHGFDIHRMAPIEEAGQPLIIAGVVVEHSNQKWLDVEGKYVSKGNVYETQLGVVAHSDGDVVYHSIVDAIFGALTLPDIGQVFQDNDARWKGCDSSKFMDYAYEVMTRYGYKIGNVDVTLILERPKVAAVKPLMKENIVRLLKTTHGRVNIKARTHERMDSAGELRSLSCHVVLTLERRTEEDDDA